MPDIIFVLPLKKTQNHGRTGKEICVSNIEALKPLYLHAIHEFARRKSGLLVQRENGYLVAERGQTVRQALYNIFYSSNMRVVLWSYVSDFQTISTSHRERVFGASLIRFSASFLSGI
jgi:hypothetical protein